MFRIVPDGKALDEVLIGTVDAAKALKMAIQTLQTIAGEETPEPAVLAGTTLRAIFEEVMHVEPARF
jgi:hypothetical protein